METVLRGRVEQLAARVPATNGSSQQLSVEALLDAFVAVFEDVKPVASSLPHLSGFMARFKDVAGEIGAVRFKESDFDTLRVLGRGGFGEVRLVRCKLDGQVYALKTLRKAKMLTEREAAFFREERDVMAQTSSPWLVQLYFAFQDRDFLYLVMEYVPGGNLAHLLDQYEEGMDEDTARVYVAETVLAIEEIHQMGWVHRDIKPANILLDKDGHVKLTDFGSASRLNARGFVESDISVGTPEYIAPEVIKAVEGGAHGMECDWWSLGATMYELLYADFPFYDESMKKMYDMIMNWKKYFNVPDWKEVSDDCKDLLMRLLCDKSQRIGANGVDELKRHPWFKGIDWDNLRKKKPPFQPKLASLDDTSHFAEVEPDPDAKSFANKSKSAGAAKFSGEELNFVGYSFSRAFNRFALRPIDGNEQAAPSGTPRGDASSPYFTPPPLSAQASSTSLKNATRDLERKLNEAQMRAENAEKDAKQLKAKADSATEQLREQDSKLQRTTADMQLAQAQLEQERSLRKELDTQKREAERVKAAAVADLDRVRALLEQEKKDRDAAEETARKQTAQAEDAKRKLKDLESSQSSLATQSDSVQQEISTLKDKLARKTKEVQDLQTSVASTTAARTAAEERAANLKQDLDKESAGRRASESTLASTTSQLRDLQAQLARATDAAAAKQKQLQSEIDEMAELTKSLETELAQAQSVSKAGESKVRAVLEGEVAQLRADLKQATAAKDALAQQLAAAKRAADDVAVELQTAKAAADAAAADGKRTQTRLAEQTAQITHLESELIAVKKQADAAKTEAFRDGERAANSKLRGQLDEQVAALQEKLGDAEKASDATARENAQLQTRLATVQAQSDELVAAQAQRAERAQADAKRTEQRLTDQLASAKQQIAALTAELHEVRQAMKKLTEDVATTSQDASQVRAAADVELEQLRAQNAAYEATLQALGRDLQTLAKHSADVEQELEDARAAADKQRDESQKRLVKAVEELKATQQLTEELEDELTALKREQAKNTSATDALKAARAAFDDERQTFELKVQTLKDELAAAEGNARSLRQQLAAVTAALATAQETADKRAQALEAAATAAKQALERDRARAQDDLQAASVRADALAKELEDERRKLTAVQSDLQVSHAGAQRIGQLEKELKVAKVDIADLNEDRVELEERIAQLRRDAQAIETREKKARAGAQAAEEERDQLQAQLTSRTTELNTVLESLKAERIDHDANVADLEKEMDMLGAKLRDSERLRVEKAALVQSLEGERAELQQRVMELQQKATAAVRAKDEFDERLATAKNRADYLEKEVAELGAKLADSEGSLQDTKMELQSTKGSLEAESVRVRELNALLERSLEQSGVIMGDAEVMRARLAEEREDWERDLVQLEKALQEANAAREHAEADLAGLRKELDMTKKSLDDTKQRLAATVEKLATSGVFEGQKKTAVGGRASTDLIKMRSEKRAMQEKLRTEEQLRMNLETRIKKLEKQLEENESELRQAQEHGSQRPRSPTPSFSSEVSLSKDASPSSLSVFGGSVRERKSFLGGTDTVEKLQALFGHGHKPSVPLKPNGPLEGTLKVRRPKNARAGFKKMFVAVRDHTMYVFEKQSDSTNLTLAVVAFNLWQQQLMLRVPTAAQIRNITEKELACTFMVIVLDGLTTGPGTMLPQLTASAEAGSSSSSSSSSKSAAPPSPSVAKAEDRMTREQIEDKIKALKADKERETRILSGARGMAQALEKTEKSNKNPSPAMLQARAQVEGCTKKIAEIERSLEALDKQLATAKKVEEAGGAETLAVPASSGGGIVKSTSSTSIGSGSDDQEALRASIRKEIEKETQKKQGLEKMISRLGGQQAEEAKRQLAEVAIRISTLQSELDHETVSATGVPGLQRETAEFNGHRFRMTSYIVPVDCHVCFQPLKVHATSPNEGFACQVCHLICHKQCHTTVTETCAIVQELKEAPPTFFIVDSEEHKFMWLTQLHLVRTQAPSSS